jgi:putative iron-dependent peroxidase
MNNISKLVRGPCASALRQVRTAATGRSGARGATYTAPLLIGGGIAMAGGAWMYRNKPSWLEQTGTVIPFVKSVAAATPLVPQANVFSPGKDHALYLWIHLKPDANAKQCAKVVANLEKFVDQVTPADLRDEEDEIWAGVGFGPNFYCQATGRKPPKEFHYPHRKGALGYMPSTGGDIFIHAKSNTVSKLFELAQVLHRSMPKGSIERFADTYSFVYQGGRDLSGFIDGTENPADEDSRFQVAVDPQTGGSFCITQKWIHRLDLIATEKDSTMEGWVGRSRPDSTELRRKPATSHVARMTSGTVLA